MLSSSSFSASSSSSFFLFLFFFFLLLLVLYFLFFLVELPHARAKLFGWHCPHLPASGLNARHEVVQRLRRFGIDDVVDQRLTVGRESERAETGTVEKG